jgi:hypothetical protein
MTALPLFVRKFLVDFIETGIAAILAFSSFGDPQTFAHAAAVAVGAAFVSAARRAYPDFKAWLTGFFGAGL